MGNFYQNLKLHSLKKNVVALAEVKQQKTGRQTGA